MNMIPVFSIGCLLGQVAAKSASSDAGLKVDSVLDFVVKGGPVMYAIIGCSLIALAVIIERCVSLRKRNVVPAEFLAGLQAFQDDPTRAIEFCRSNNSPIARIIAVVLKRRGERIETIEKAVEDVGHREVIGLRQRMRVLGALPQVSTMLGLLGTIFGMIKTFQAVAASGQSLGKTEALAKGIFEAWTNTAAGLLVAIPVLIAYHLLLGRIDALMVELDRAASDFVEAETGRRMARRRNESDSRPDAKFPDEAAGVLSSAAAVA